MRLMRLMFATLSLIGIGTMLLGTLSLVNSVYPTTMSVDSIDGDVVTLRTSTGLYYQMTGAEDYEVDDLCSLLMYDNHTESVLDDVILRARYCGFRVCEQSKPYAVETPAVDVCAVGHSDCVAIER